jgi:NAD(P)-dependent dehydrogenase (short-subunit alcohol dehydrogenase family)
MQPNTDTNLASTSGPGPAGTGGGPGHTVGTPRACLITGAAKRLGSVIALAMAAAGWNVAVHYRNSEKEALSVVNRIQAIGRKAIAIKADLDHEASTRQLFASASEGLGGIQCVINSASRFEYDQPNTASPLGLQQHFQSNLVAPMLLTQLLYESLKPKHQEGQDPLGVVIHLLDQKLANPNPDFFSYTLSKAALLEALRLSAMAMAPVLRVVGVAPGLTLPSADQTQAEFEISHAMTPLGASSRPDEVANAICWLASARAVTGTTLYVDGGQHLLPMPQDVMMMIRSKK